MYRQRIEINGEPISSDVIWQAFTLDGATVEFTVLRDGKQENIEIGSILYYQSRGKDEQGGRLVGFAGYIKNEDFKVNVDYNCRTGLGWINFS